MSTEHLNRKSLERLARRELNPGELIEALRHIDGCVECAARAAAFNRASDDDLRAFVASDQFNTPTEAMPVLHDLNPTTPHRGWGLLAAIAASVIVLLIAFSVLRDRKSMRTEWLALMNGAIARHALPYPDDRGAVVVREQLPHFTWPSREGATYVVLLFEGENEVARSAVLSSAEWTPQHNLQRGATYAARVQVTNGEVLAPVPALVRITSVTEEEDLRAALAAHPEDRFLHAILFARAGLSREAEEALARAVASADKRALEFQARTPVNRP